MCSLHKQGHIATNYIDNIFLQGINYKDCVTNVIDTITQFTAIGFIIHPDKSDLDPSQTIVALGFVIDSRSMTVKLTSDKASSIVEACKGLLHKPTHVIREVARVIGMIVASFPGVMHGPLYYRNLEGTKTNALKHNAGKYDNTMSLSNLVAISDLNWWIDKISNSYNKISHGLPDHTLTTDASLKGWGASYNNTSTGGTWSSDEEKGKHINYLEILAVFMGLQTFLKTFSNTHVRLMIDNTTAIASNNHMGTQPLVTA